MTALADDLQNSDYFNIQTQFVAISLLTHPRRDIDFIRTVLIFHQNRYGAVITELPQNSLVVTDLFDKPLDQAVNILLVIVFVLVAILGSVLLTYSILAVIRRYKRLKEKEMKMTVDAWWTICQRSVLLGFAISFIIAFLAIIFKLVKPVNKILQNPVSATVDKLLWYFQQNRLLLVFGVIIVVVFLFAFLVFSMQLALYYNMFNNVLLTFALYQIPVLTLFLALSISFLQVFGDRIESIAKMPFLVTTLLCIFDKNLFFDFDFYNPGTLPAALPVIFITVSFLVACIASFPFAYIHLALTHNLRILEEIQQKKVHPLTTRLRFWMCRVFRKKERHKKDSLEIPSTNMPTTTNQDSETQVPNSARPFLYRSGSILEQ